MLWVWCDDPVTILARDSFTPGRVQQPRVTAGTVTWQLFSSHYSSPTTSHITCRRSVIPVMATQQTFVSFVSYMPSPRIPWKIRISNYYWVSLSLSLSHSVWMWTVLYNCVNHKDNMLKCTVSPKQLSTQHWKVNQNLKVLAISLPPFIHLIGKETDRKKLDKIQQKPIGRKRCWIWRS